MLGPFCIYRFSKKYFMPIQNEMYEYKAGLCARKQGSIASKLRVLVAHRTLFKCVQFMQYWY